jgi:hypothetical protein
VYAAKADRLGYRQSRRRKDKGFRVPRRNREIFALALVLARHHNLAISITHA